MEIDLYLVLKDNGLILLFLVIGLGYLIGHIKIFSLPLGPTIGVLVVGLYLGHHGLNISPGVGSFGFALFIFSIGLQAGPSFFSVFREDGKKYIMLALTVAFVGLGLTVFLSRLFGIGNGYAAGLMAGALTSTPTLAAAQDAVQSGVASSLAEIPAEQLIENIGVGYALTYLVGTILVILIIRYVPGLMRLNLEAMARTYAKEKGLLLARGKGLTTADTLPVVRAYRVSPDGHGKTIEQRRLELKQEGVALKIRRRDQLLEPDPQLELQEGDILSLVASLKVHQWVQDKLGFSEVLDADLLDYRVVSDEVVVLDSHVLGKPLKELNLSGRFGCFATGLNRSGVDLPISDEVVLNKGDRVQVVGEESRLRELASMLGYVEQEVEETDLATFSFGIVIGALIGLITLSIAGVSVGLGTAGGLLVVGLVIGYMGSVNPTFGRVPGAARYLLKELGLMLLMASIGVNAGGGIVEGLISVGPAIIACAVVVATVPLAVGYLIGRKLFKMNPVLLLGSLAGAMTSTPALAVVTDAAKSGVPAIGYAGTYTFANVILTFAGTFLMSL
ncbi:MAG: transporter [Candidatus Thiodiazotropha sp. (ex Monitilora ramsayi)]|nr:transporter [Candidatus Thiodiazotropha sp. (ex Monitilora ramsayi)]